MTFEQDEEKQRHYPYTISFPTLLHALTINTSRMTIKQIALAKLNPPFVMVSMTKKNRNYPRNVIGSDNDVGRVYAL